MAVSRLTPVVIGVGDVVNRSRKVEDALEPAHLMLEAINKAIEDTNVAAPMELRSRIDSIDVVASWTWPYEDLPGLLASKLGAEPHHSFIPSFHGGNQPAMLFDEAARRISNHECRLAVVCGGEALASLAACAKAQQLPPPNWTTPSVSIESVFSPTTRELDAGPGRLHKIGAPIHIYPLYENAFRASLGQTMHDNNIDSAEMYAEFARLAANHPYAWNYDKPAETAEMIGTSSDGNRTICFPCNDISGVIFVYLLTRLDTLKMNAFNTVNLAAACILTSTEFARSIGVPESKWVYPLGGAGTRDSYRFWERPNYHTSPSISRSLDAGLEASGLVVDDIDAFDFYSCFPIVPKIACQHLGISIRDPEKRISLLGGLTSFGGAGNNYSMHAITEMTRQIRAQKIKNGLILANGGYLTYQHVVCLSRNPRQYEPVYPVANPLPEVLDSSFPEVDAEAEGGAFIETYTVEYDRTNKPVRGFVVGRMQDSGHRFIANHGDANTLSQLVSTTIEPIGRKGIVKKDTEIEGRNLFSFGKDMKL